ncbi:Ethylene-responsive transcription factor ERF022 [Camellia lanceoleosa]|uniref:Ethylene-responsive transcription factor ERF022 n=1 Tax=Camellia lanceoleosa TaxID=1840588 RepID=A0ACC0FVD8_9ERIC|nr:Ethylene-responsive transcription factor ERF022 [Camellia lanceoleosa]
MEEDQASKHSTDHTEEFGSENGEMGIRNARTRQENPNMMRSGGDGSNLVPIRVGLSPSQIQAINESPLDSPKMWMELAGALLSAEPMVLSHDIDELRSGMKLSLILFGISRLNMYRIIAINIVNKQ